MEVELLPISAVVPTHNRRASLERMLKSLAQQSVQPIEMIVVDSSADNETAQLCSRQDIPLTLNPLPQRGRGKGEGGALETKILYHRAIETGAATQRNQAIRYASQNTIWFVDDDVILETDCLMKLWSALKADPSLGGVNAMIVNQKYSPPGFASRMLFRFLNGHPEASYAGKCIGPAFNLLPEDRDDLPEAVPVEWLNTTCTLYRREALPEPPFPEHFQGYSMMEDVALSLVVSREWKLANARTARIFHDSQGGDHKRDIAALAEMELVNRHYAMTEILGLRKPSDFLKLVVLEGFNLISKIMHPREWRSLSAVLIGKTKGFLKIISLGLRRRRDDPYPPENIYPLW